MENIFIALLPPWVETGTQPAFYDQESGTVLQQTARMYAKVNELTSNFNAFSKDVSDTVNDYIEQFNALYNYVHDYFDNLDVQNEINNKLDAMVADGSFQILLDAYVQPKLDELDNKIDETKTDLESELSNEARIREVSDGNLQSQINGLASGSPLVASSTSEMTDKNRVYVNTTDGHWYYWDGSAWTDGGTYQASEDSDTVNELISHVNCVDADLGAISKIVYLDPDNFEVGSLSVVDNVLESRPGYTGRVSSKLANGISLKRGQTIALRSEASGVYRFGGYKYVDGTYTSIYWKTDPFIVPEDGVYYLTISKITEETVVNIYDYTNQVNILKEKYDAINVTSRNDTMLYMENLANYFEMGNIIIGASPARPVYGNSTTRYRTRMNSYLYLREGDIIEFSEAGWRLYIGWYDESGNWHYHSGWVDDRYIITQTGYYVFVCRTQQKQPLAILQMLLVNLLLNMVMLSILNCLKRKARMTELIIVLNPLLIEDIEDFIQRIQYQLSKVHLSMVSMQ